MIAVGTSLAIVPAMLVYEHLRKTVDEASESLFEVWVVSRLPRVEDWKKWGFDPKFIGKFMFLQTAVLGVLLPLLTLLFLVARLSIYLLMILLWGLLFSPPKLLHFLAKWLGNPSYFRLAKWMIMVSLLIASAMSK